MDSSSNILGNFTTVNTHPIQNKAPKVITSNKPEVAGKVGAKKMIIGVAAATALAAIVIARIIINRGKGSQSVENLDDAANLIESKTHSKEQKTDAYLTYLDYSPMSETLKYMQSLGDDGISNVDKYYGGGLHNVITHSGEFPNQEHYTNLLLNILENPAEREKLNKIGIALSKKYDEISNKIRNSIPDIQDGLKQNHYNDCKIDQNPYLSCDIKVFVLRDLMKKKYYAANKNVSNSLNYALEDPVASQKAREEIIDTHLGWDLLQKDFDIDSNPSLIELLKDKYSFSTEEQGLMKKMSEASSVSGTNSQVHSHELKHLGKIFREKININVD